MAKHYLDDNDVKILKKVVRQILKDPSILAGTFSETDIVQNIFMGVDSDEIAEGLFEGVYEGADQEIKFFNIVRKKYVVPDPLDPPTSIELEDHTDDDGNVHVQPYIELPTSAALFLRDAFGTIVKVKGEAGGGLVNPCNLEKAAGLPGDTTNKCSWTYYVQDSITGEWWTNSGFGNKTNRIAIDPLQFPHRYARSEIGRYAVATFGYYHWEDDDICVGWINEVYDVKICG